MFYLYIVSDVDTTLEDKCIEGLLEKEESLRFLILLQALGRTCTHRCGSGSEYLSCVRPRKKNNEKIHIKIGAI